MQNKEAHPFGQNVIICSDSFESDVSNCGIEPTFTREYNLEESTIISNRAVIRGLEFGTNQGFGVSGQLSIQQNSPYLFKIGKPSIDTSSSRAHGVDFETASLFNQQFEKKEKVELMKEVSFAVDRLIQKNEDFKIIKRQKLLDKMSIFVDDFTPAQMVALKNNETELSNRLDKIMAIEAMSERLKALPPEERLKR